MVSKLIIRTVLLGVVTLLSWAGWWTWSHQFENIAQKVMLLLIEGGVLLAAASLLVETFQSFGSLSAKKKSWKSVLFGYNFYQDGEVVRTCELFALRSVLLAIVALMASMCVVALWDAVKFLFNPHAVAVSWVDVGKFIAHVVGALASATAMIGGFEWLKKKNSGRNQIFQWVVGGLYWAGTMSIFLGVTAVLFIKDPTLLAMPLYWAFIYASDMSFLALLFLSAVLGLGYGLFKLAGRAILGLNQKFPGLVDAICPVQTIHFVE